MVAGIICDIVDENASFPQIAPATWRDVKAVDALEKACFGEDAWALIELLGTLMFPGVVTLKAIVGNKLAGFIAGSIRRDTRTGWIMTVGVMPDWRRRGIAEALLRECEIQMEMPTVRLTVRRKNEPAIKLYQKLGYSQVEIWPKYYHNGEDGLVLEKMLKDAG